MVTSVNRVWRCAYITLLMWLFAAQSLCADVLPVDESVLQRMDPPRRAKVLAAIAGLIILGLGMMLLAWLGAKATRRYMNREPILRQRPPTSTPVREKDWAEKPLGRPSDE